MLLKKSLITLISCCLAQIAFAYPSMEGIQDYQRDVHLSPNRKQILDDDIVRYHNADDIWNSLRQEFSLQHYENTPQVQAQINWFMMHQDFLLRSATRAAPYLYYILQQARIRHLPIELVLLPIIESAYNPFAYSRAGASGVWQLMPGAASDYGVKHDRWYDGRRDVIASTKAALNYLSYLGNLFNNDWLLAIASYDTGLGNVSYAVNRNIREGTNTDFWSLRLAQETRIYVPRLLALAAIVANPDKYPVYLPPIRNAPYLAQLELGAQIDLKHAAAFAGLSYKNLMQLNSGFNRNATDPAGKHKLVLPIQNVVQFSENLRQSPLYQQGVTNSYVDTTNDTLVNLAAQLDNTNNKIKNQNAFDTTAQDISDYNRYLANKDSNDESRASTTVEIYEPQYKTPTPSPQKVETPKGNYSIQPGDTIYMTRAGDDLDKIAKRFHVTQEQLLAANPLDTGNALLSDQRLVIPTHLTNTQVVNMFEPKKQLVSGDTIYIVRSGDTIEKIAKQYHLTVPEIRIANLIADSDIRDGDKLIIPTHA